MDSFEKYILENREELDGVERPDEEALWNGISNKINTPVPSLTFSPSRPLNMWKKWAVAATIAAVAGWGILLFQKTEQEKPVELSLSDISPALAAEEAHFQKLIRQKEQEIGFDQLDRRVYQEVFGELEELESTSAEARKDIAGFPDNERVVEALKRYYELKIRILETLSNEIEKQKYHDGLEKNL